MGLLARSAPLAVGGNSLSWVKACFVFARFAVGLRKSQGDRGLAIFLKTCNVTLLRYLGNGKRTEPRLVGAAVSQTHSGIPRMIPGAHRKRIRQGDRGVIRLWLSFFTLYRVLKYAGKMNFSTITAPGVVISSRFMREWDAHIVRFRDQLKEMGGPALKTIFVPSRPSRGDDVRQFGDVKHHPVDGMWFPPDGLIRKEILGYTVRCIALMTSSPNTSSEEFDEARKRRLSEGKTEKSDQKKDYGRTVSVINVSKEIGRAHV